MTVCRTPLAAQMETAGEAQRNRLRPAIGRLARWPWMAIVIGCIALAAYALPGVTELLIYDRQAIAEGQWWRLLTGHVAHWSADHLFWDVLMFVALAAVAERDRRIMMIAVTAVSMAAISATLWFGQPTVAGYAGLSGVDAALWTWVLGQWCGRWFVERRWLPVAIAGALLMGFVGKVAYEWVVGETLFMDSVAAGVAPLPLAHVAGAVVGSFAAAIRLVFSLAAVTGERL